MRRAGLSARTTDGRWAPTRGGAEYEARTDAMATEHDDAVTIRARFASRRAGWNDNYSCQVWLPDGRTCACGAPTPEQASEGAQKWAAQMLGQPVRLLFMKRQPRRTDKGRQKGGDA